MKALASLKSEMPMTCGLPKVGQDQSREAGGKGILSSAWGP